MGDDPSESRLILDNPKSLASAHGGEKPQTVSMPVTTSSLVELERQQEMLWADPVKATTQREDHTRRIREGAVKLGVDMTSPIYKDMGKSLDGMTPMERFVDGKSNHYMRQSSLWWNN